LETKV